ncbi:putative acetyltransferase YhhY [Oxobacter pfennigii]|uniref:Putative acetyltransferase YhhY n=1 Tax=Oxobacter pfennigii TaxID=36849 RepID=A0A0N8NTN0_9CLOT|nr:GNAT family N-acetyltransferase [Oxobacter pfennigii]KPU45288.1 putative acetyltransferase YhhY [Oxobacter pfennigii]
MLKGKLVNIRWIKNSDLKYIFEWINDPEIQFFAQEDYPITFNQWHVRRIYSDGIKGKRYVFIIEDKTGYVIGELWLYPIDLRKKMAELVIVIGRKNFHGRGYGKDAINTIKKYCFEKLKLEAIYLKVFSFNRKAINCYLSCGFKTIGKGVKKVLRGDRYFEELIMELRKE